MNFVSTAAIVLTNSATSVTGVIQYVSEGKYLIVHVLYKNWN